MFSGIVQATARVGSARMCGRCRRVEIRTPRDWKLSLGESVNINGVCSTVVASGAKSFAVEYMPHTLKRTTAFALVADSTVNLERSLKWGGRVHGHFVAGHVDARARVVQTEKEGRSRLVTFSIPPTLSKYVTPRGSVAINGVSLTVARQGKNKFSVALIPHTLAATNLDLLTKGSMVNLECDMLARYGRLNRHAKRNRTRSAR